jgi:ABC-type molybdenum transport system ATPase subunit/photorepair protein PhrA
MPHNPMFRVQRMPHARMCASRRELPHTLIDIRGIHYMLSVKLTHKLFRNTDLSIRENEFDVITGENGAGKSTRMSPGDIN